MDDATLHELVDDELDPAVRQRVEAHLATCGECARRFADATAMARQVVSLLTALDEGAPPKLTVTPGARRDVNASVSAVAAPARRRPLPAVQWIAIAASVMLVAGVSYQVGKRGDPREADVAADRAPSTDSMLLPAPMAAAEKVAVLPSAAARAAAPSTSGPAGAAQRGELRAAAPPSAERTGTAERSRLRSAAPPAIERPSISEREAMRADESGAVASGAQRAGAALQRRAAVQDSRVGEQSAGASALRARALGMPDSNASNVASVGAALRAAAAPSTLPARELAGYATVEERTAPAVTRRRYVSPSGTALVLTIVQVAGGASASAAGAATAPEYVVSASNGRSTVRWQAQGRTYELQGALPADSLMRLATQLR